MNYSFLSYTRVLAVVAAIAGIYLFWPTRLFFLNDDFLHLYLTQQGHWLQQNSLRPVCDISMWLDYQGWGLNPVGFHITNALLHLVNTILVYQLAVMLFRRYHQAAVASSNALLVAVVFFLYAFHAETIFWVIGRSASLGALFFLLSLQYYLRRLEHRSNFYRSLLFFAIGLLTYESVWVLPVCLFIVSMMDVRSGTTTSAKEWRNAAAVAVVFGIYLVFRSITQHNLIGTYEGERFLHGDIRGLAANLVKLFLRSYARQSGPLYLVTAALLVSVMATISFFFKRARFAVAVLLMFICSLFPYLSLGIDTFGYEGERYLYLPSIFLSIIIALGMANASLYYKYVVSLLFFFIQVSLLYLARKDFEVASATAKATVEALQSNAAQQAIYLRQLPAENDGALIFRTGIEAAQQLFVKGHKSHLITVSAFQGNYNFFNGVFEQQWADDLPGTQGKDAVFDYSGYVLTVYR